MALGLLRGGLLVGAAVAVGSWIGPSLWRNARPVAKSALKTGMGAAEAARVAAARLAEDIEDLVAEVRHEMSDAEPEAGGPAAGKAEPDADD